MAEKHEPSRDRVEYGFALPNGKIVWGYWDTLELHASDIVDSKGRVRSNQLQALRERYASHLMGQLGLTRAQINGMPDLQIVTRTQKVYYTDAVEVH